MNEQSKMISKMLRQRPVRESYLRSKLSVLLPSQIRSLRERRGMKQSELGVEADMKQARISALERIGDVGFSLASLIRIAAAFRVGLIVKFVPHSEMLEWENNYSPDSFDATSLDQDKEFLLPAQYHSKGKALSPGLREALSGDENPCDRQVSNESDCDSLNFSPSIGRAMLSAGETSIQEESVRGNAA